MDFKILNKDFYLNDTLDTAKGLLGKYLIRRTGDGCIYAKITEVEAYIGRMDKASHAYNYKKTERTKIMFESGGIAYVYLIYGMYYCLNVVTEQKGEPCAVLIRGAEVTEGTDQAAISRYKKAYGELNASERKNLSNGPGKLCMAMDITKDQNGTDLSQGALVIAEDIAGSNNTMNEIKESTRIGIDYAEEAKDFLWRFELKECGKN